MAKRSVTSGGDNPASNLYWEAHKRRHPTLFLPRLLAEEADAPILRGADLDRAAAILADWADKGEKGHLRHKETSLDADFLEKIFGDALGYRSVTENPLDYHREKSFAISGIGIADGALGRYAIESKPQTVAVIELKGADTDLDYDKSNGRTAVQQCWDYMNYLPEAKWGIVSNYVTVRLYHRNSGARAYEEFTIRDFRDPARVRQFYFIFHKYGLLGNKVQPPRAEALLGRTQARQREVGNDLYEDYSNQRAALIHHLISDHGKTQDEAIHIAQKLLDRIIFMAFCEDRALLPENLIHRAFNELPAFTKVTNPRWQNFKNLFGLIDKGDSRADIPEFDGGLFRNDPAVDELELDDEWTHFFDRVGWYDFRDEVNVEVLGQLFERSVTELEKLRVVGLFGKEFDREVRAEMPKSAQRKRFGIYYTPPDFTRLIVERTLGALIEERVDVLSDPIARVTELRRIKVCDPACGSGAFLIASYERFEQSYEDVVRLLRLASRDKEAESIADKYPDYILNDNLFGVDLSAESIEITQLALWIRSARKGRTLADLSGNILCGNSLVTDPKIHPRGFDWPQGFPAIFSGRDSGFDVVVGNPPWERIKQQKREFFAFVPEVLSEPNAERARQLIDSFERTRPELHGRWLNALQLSSRISSYARSSGDFPLTATGDTNYAMLFAELSRKIVAATGRIGLLVPSGVATDDTTRHFFNDLIEKRTLIALYDFENKDAVFADVHRSFKFCVLLMAGAKKQTDKADFVFFARKVEDLKSRDRHIELTPKDLKLLNPKTRTSPIFRNRRDAELTKFIYRNVSILVDDARREGGNPWGIKFQTMFHQSGKAELFKNPEELKSRGFKLVGANWSKGKELFLPLYEAKMVQAYDHRAASIVTQTANWLRHGQKEETSLVEHQNPEFCVLPRWWVAADEVLGAMGGKKRWGFLGFKDVSSATNERTMISAMIPFVAVTHHFPLVITAATAKRETCLLANLNSRAYDFIARQKLGGTTFGFYHLEQIPTLPPDRYEDKCPWEKKRKLEDWVAERVLKLTCTSEDMVPLAEAAGFKPRIHKWKEDERALLRAELDAAYFILYGIERADVEYILGTFQGIVKEDKADDGSGETRQLILEAFDSFVA